MHAVAAIIATSWSVTNANKYVAVDALTPISNKSKDGSADCMKKKMKRIITIEKSGISGIKRWMIR